MENRGKTLTIFTILIMVLLICSTSIGFFLYNQETRSRKDLQSQLDSGKYNEMKLQGDLKELRHQLSLAQDKAKEADDKINNLMDEMEVNDGLRKELKNENAALKEALEAQKKDREKILKDLDEARKKYQETSELFKSEQDRAGALQMSLAKLQAANADALKEIASLRAAGTAQENGIAAKPAPARIELDKIVVNPNDGIRGKVVSVDRDSEFIVASLGARQGVKIADVLAVYRGDEYLGDVRVSRVQQELCAADIIPPFSSGKVRKNDTVVFRP